MLPIPHPDSEPSVEEGEGSYLDPNDVVDVIEV